MSWRFVLLGTKSTKSASLWFKQVIACNTAQIDEAAF